MKVTINGDLREIPGGLSVPAMLEHLKLRADRVAIERNLDVLPRHLWRQTMVAEGDRYEIVQLVGGG